MPSELAESLKFLDDTAVAVRKPGVRSLTEIASMRNVSMTLLHPAS